MVDFAVAGVSGNTGRVVAETLLAGGASVRVIVRDAAKGAAWAARGADVAVADLGDSAALAEALRGVKGAYLLVPPNAGASDFRAYQRATGESIVAAVRASGVPHVVFLSSVGAQHDAGTGPIAALKPVEAGLRGIAGTVSTFVRAAYFMENLGGSLSSLGDGLLPGFVPTDLAFPMIATRDIGLVAAAALREPPAQTEVIELDAPRLYSMDDAAAALSKLTGKTITARQFPIEAMVPTLTGFGFPPGLAALYAEMTAAMISGHVTFEGGHRRVHGATAIETVLAGLVNGA